ncbi:hypothetical protein Tco_0198834 [Tanacetum coccineum]
MYLHMRQGSWQEDLISEGKPFEPGLLFDDDMHWQRRKNIVLVLILGAAVLQGMLRHSKSSDAHSQPYASVQGNDSSMVRLHTDLMRSRYDTLQGTAALSRTLNFEDEAGPSSPLRPIQVMESEEQLKVAEVLVAISRPRGLSIPGPIQSQSQPQQPSQATDPKDKGKGILVEEPKKKKLTLQQIRALETTNDEEVARKIQAEWNAEEERKRFEELKKTKPKTTLRKPTSLAQERNQMMNFLKDSFKDLFQWSQRRKGDVGRKRSKKTLKEKKLQFLKNSHQRSLVRHRKID